MSAERLLTTGEAARALGISHRSLARWAREGQVTPEMITPGGQYRFRLDSLKDQIRRLAEKRK